MLRTEPITSETIRDLITAGMEPTEPFDTILAVLKENDGKVYTKRIMEIIREKTQAYCEFSSYLCDYDRSIKFSLWYKKGLDPRGNESRRTEMKLPIASDSGPRYINAAEFERKNVWAYSARNERNAKRREWLDDPERIRKLAEQTEAMRLYLSRFQELNNTAVFPDYYAWRNLFGVELENLD